MEISATLGQIHALGYVYRDVKPDNILVRMLLTLEFGRGLARHSNLEVLGTVGFMCK